MLVGGFIKIWRCRPGRVTTDLGPWYGSRLNPHPVISKEMILHSRRYRYVAVFVATVLTGVLVAVWSSTAGSVPKGDTTNTTTEVTPSPTNTTQSGGISGTGTDKLFYNGVQPGDGS